MAAKSKAPIKKEQWQITLLETCFAANPRPSADEYDNIAQRSQLPKSTVKAWYKDKRRGRRSTGSRRRTCTSNTYHEYRCSTPDSPSLSDEEEEVAAAAADTDDLYAAESLVAISNGSAAGGYDPQQAAALVHQLQQDSLLAGVRDLQEVPSQQQLEQVYGLGGEQPFNLCVLGIRVKGHAYQNLHQLAADVARVQPPNSSSSSSSSSRQSPRMQVQQQLAKQVQGLAPALHKLLVKLQPPQSAAAAATAGAVATAGMAEGPGSAALAMELEEAGASAVMAAGSSKEGQKAGGIAAAAAAAAPMCSADTCAANPTAEPAQAEQPPAMPSSPAAAAVPPACLTPVPSSLAAGTRMEDAEAPAPMQLPDQGPPPGCATDSPLRLGAGRTPEVARADAKLAQLLMAEEQAPRRQLRSSTRTKQVLAEQAARALDVQRRGQLPVAGQELAVGGAGPLGERDACLQLPDFCDAEVAAANKLLATLYSVLQQEAARCHGLACALGCPVPVSVPNMLAAPTAPGDAPNLQQHAEGHAAAAVPAVAGSSAGEPAPALPSGASNNQPPLLQAPSQQQQQQQQQQQEEGMEEEGQQPADDAAQPDDGRTGMAGSSSQDGAGAAAAPPPHLITPCLRLLACHLDAISLRLAVHVPQGLSSSAQAEWRRQLAACPMLAHHAPFASLGHFAGSLRLQLHTLRASVASGSCFAQHSARLLEALSQELHAASAVPVPASACDAEGVQAVAAAGASTGLAGRQAAWPPSASEAAPISVSAAAAAFDTEGLPGVCGVPAAAAEGAAAAAAAAAAGDPGAGSDGAQDLQPTSHTQAAQAAQPAVYSGTLRGLGSVAEGMPDIQAAGGACAPLPRHACTISNQFMTAEEQPVLQRVSKGLEGQLPHYVPQPLASSSMISNSEQQVATCADAVPHSKSPRSSSAAGLVDDHHSKRRRLAGPPSLAAAAAGGPVGVGMDAAAARGCVLLAAADLFVAAQPTCAAAGCTVLSKLPDYMCSSAAPAAAAASGLPPEACQAPIAGLVAPAGAAGCSPELLGSDNMPVVPPRKGSSAGVAVGLMLDRDQHRCAPGVAPMTAATGAKLPSAMEHVQLLTPSAAVPVQSSP